MDDVILALIVLAGGFMVLGLIIAACEVARANPNDWARHKAERGGFWANFWGRTPAEHDETAHFALCLRTGKIKRYMQRLTDDAIDTMDT